MDSYISYFQSEFLFDLFVNFIARVEFLLGISQLYFLNELESSKNRGKVNPNSLSLRRKQLNDNDNYDGDDTTML